MPKFLPWADPPAGTYDRQHGTKGKGGDPTKNYEIITQAGRESRGFLDRKSRKRDAFGARPTLEECRQRRRRLVTGGLPGCVGNRAKPRLNYVGQFISPEILAFSGSHLRHGGVGLAVIVTGIPEQKANSAGLFRRLDLHFNI